jgi:hypothetical protein
MIVKGTETKLTSSAIFCLPHYPFLTQRETTKTLLDLPLSSTRKSAMDSGDDMPMNKYCDDYFDALRLFQSGLLEESIEAAKYNLTKPNSASLPSDEESDLDCYRARRLGRSRSISPTS